MTMARARLQPVKSTRLLPVILIGILAAGCSDDSSASTDSGSTSSTVADTTTSTACDDDHEHDDPGHHRAFDIDQHVDHLDHVLDHDLDHAGARSRAGAACERARRRGVRRRP